MRYKKGKRMEIKLYELKIALFDFDNTLCIHNEHIIQTRVEFETDVLKHGASIYKTAEPNIHMKKFMNLCMENDVHIGLLSTTKSCKEAEGKLEWVKKQYGAELENYCVGTQEAKLEMMEALANAYRCDKDEIALIDDYWYQINRADEAGFRAYSPMQIVNFIDEHNSIER